MAIIFLERIGTYLGNLVKPRRALAFGAGFTLTDKPTDSLVGSPDAPGGVTGYTLVERDPAAVVTASEVITDALSIGGKAIAGIGEATTVGAVTATILTIGVPQHSSVGGTFEVHARHRGSTAGLLGGALWPGVIATARGTGSAEDNSSVGAAYIDPTGSEVDGANANGSISGSVNWILQVNGIAATTIDWLVFYRVSTKATN